jgi:ABC-type lipoprotein release transport system permease subunit
MFSLLNYRVGLFLAVRQIRRASRWTTGLIVFVMLLTFLNLVVVTGVLVGIIDGIGNLFRAQQTGDVIISTLDTKNYIERSPEVIAFVSTLPQVDMTSPRYVAGGELEANYKTRTFQNDKPNKTAAQIVGIDPVSEDRFSHLASLVGEGDYLTPNDYDEILLGAQLLAKYSFGRQPGLSPLENIEPGTVIRVTVGNATREMRVKGIVRSTANSPDASRAFILNSEFVQMAARTDYSVNEIPIRLKSGADPIAFRDLLLKSGIGSEAKVQTYVDAIPNGVADIRNTFAMLGNAFSSVGLVVASITIFIVIFINALTRRKFIGILKGIGISGEAIEIAYIFQSFFYAAIGSGIGLLVLYGFLVPYVAVHPIVLPISNAIISAPVPDTLVRVALLIVATVIAGYIPARMIVQKNTLESILGRN